MGDLLIRDLSPEPHAELKRRAQDAGMSLQTYVARLLDRSTAVPPVADCLARAVPDRVSGHAE
ncbi:MAG: FitA-like ribbon-helix-helix domain-containing protein [Actinomycetota bacterium]